MTSGTFLDNIIESLHVENTVPNVTIDIIISTHIVIINIREDIQGEGKSIAVHPLVLLISQPKTTQCPLIHKADDADIVLTTIIGPITDVPSPKIKEGIDRPTKKVNQLWI